MTQYRELTHKEITDLATRISEFANWFLVKKFAEKYVDNPTNVSVELYSEYNDEGGSSMYISEVSIETAEGDADLKEVFFRKQKEELVRNTLADLKYDNTFINELIKTEQAAKDNWRPRYTGDRYYGYSQVDYYQRLYKRATELKELLSSIEAGEETEKALFDFFEGEIDDSMRDDMHSDFPISFADYDDVTSWDLTKTPMNFPKVFVEVDAKI